MLCFCIAGFTTEIVHDANTLLLLKGNNSPNGAEGEIPDGQNVSYTSGVANEAFSFDLGSNYLQYSNSFFDATSGTVETWVKPFWDGLVDEFRISNVARSASEINNTYAAGLDNFSIDLQEPPGDFYPGWTKTMVLNRITDFGDFPINNSQASWSTSNASIASIDAQGEMILP